MLKYLKKYWGWCLMAPVFMAGEVCMDLLQPDLMKMIVDEGVMKQNMSIIVTYGIRMILLVMFGACCGIASGVCANFGAQNFSNDLRKGLFAKIMNLSFQQTDSFTTGSLVTRLTNDVTQVERMVMFAVRGAVRNVFLFVGSIIMLARLSGDYPKTAIIAFPIVFLAMTFFLMKATPLFSVVQMKLDGVNNVMQEDVAGARVVKAYVKEEYELSRFDKANDALCSVNLKVQLLLAFMMPVMNIILNACVLAIIYISGMRNRDLVMLGDGANAAGAVTAGTITAGITYLSQLLHGIMFLANIFQTFTRSKASANRINEVLRVEDVVMDGELSAQEIREKCEGHRGSVEFKDVAFSYPGGNGKAVLEHIDLKVEPGETLAIIGATGCGKSSLVNLIPRFYDVAEGEILVDGVNVKDYPLKDLRDKIAIVLQKAELYSRPIEANIRWGKSDATDWEVKEAAQIAQADDFICKTADGYYTQVTEGGHSLSGGQKQRISVARAMLKDAEILILDDATSALDLKTEAALYAGMKEKIPDVTKIIIAQRIASIQNADRIAVLEDGCIVACGSHSELMADSPVYREIYNSQMKEGESA